MAQLFAVLPLSEGPALPIHTESQNNTSPVACCNHLPGPIWSCRPACSLGIGAEERNTLSRPGEVLTKAPLSGWLQLDFNLIATQKITFFEHPKI